MKKYNILYLFLLLMPLVSAQEQWSLSKCIEYAIENNVSVQQRLIEIERHKIQLNTAKMSRLPGIDASVGENFSFGRSTGVDNVINDYSSSNTSLNVSASMPLFTGFRIPGQISMKKYDIRASLADLEKAKNDLAINVTGYYLQILFYEALCNISAQQVTLAQEQVVVSQKLHDAGKVAESELYESKAQLAKNQLDYTESRNNLTMAKLDLTQLLNLEEYTDFELSFHDNTQSPDISSLPPMYDIYQKALEIWPSVKAAKYRIESYEKSLIISRSQYYPSLYLNGGYSNMYNFNYNLPDGFANGSFRQQFKTNGSEYVGVTLQIPVFNRFATRNAVRESRLNIKNEKLQLLNARQNIFKEVQQAYANAVASSDKLISAKTSVQASEIAYLYEEKKFNLGRSTAYDLNTARVRLERSKSEEAQAYFEYILRYKILEFYDGRPIK